MPIYEYKCQNCDIIIEREAKIGTAPKKIKCKKCGKFCERYFSTPLIQFKGSGFYCNDSKVTSEN